MSRRVAAAVLLCQLTTLAADPCRGEPSDGQVLGREILLDRGPAASRFNIVIMSEGYRDSEMLKFHDDAATFSAAIVGEMGFDDCHTGVNIYRIDVTSTDSGADGHGPARRTFADE